MLDDNQHPDTGGKPGLFNEAFNRRKILTEFMEVAELSLYFDIRRLECQDKDFHNGALFIFMRRLIFPLSTGHAVGDGDGAALEGLCVGGCVIAWRAGGVAERTCFPSVC